MERWWCLSYADEKGFRGAVIVEGAGFKSAVHSARMLGASPGGQVLGYPLTIDKVPERSFCNRLLTRAEVLHIWPRTLALRDAVATGAISDEEALELPTLCAKCEAGSCTVH